MSSSGRCGPIIRPFCWRRGRELGLASRFGNGRSCSRTAFDYPAGQMPAPAQIVVMPSILSADFTALGAAVDEVIDAGATVIHCDVMDGQFVPPITFGAQIVAQLRDRLPDHI